MQEKEMKRIVNKAFDEHHEEICQYVVEWFDSEYNAVLKIIEESKKELIEKLTEKLESQSKWISVEEIISYIENDSEIPIPIDRMRDEDGSRITRKKYGLILIEILCKELREKFN